MNKGNSFTKGLDYEVSKRLTFENRSFRSIKDVLASEPHLWGN